LPKAALPTKSAAISFPGQAFGSASLLISFSLWPADQRPVGQLASSGILPATPVLRSFSVSQLTVPNVTLVTGVVAMFEILPNPSIETMLIVGRAVLLFGAFWVFALAFIRWRRADERATAALHAKFDRAFSELRSLHETVSVMSARLDGMSERSEMESHRAPASSQRSYDVATRLARNGASVDEMIANCGITRHEAELLARLHGAREPQAPLPAAARPQQRAVAQAPVRPQQPPQAAPQAQPANTGRKRGSLLSVVG
jgi:hypothetical protein